MRISDWSSDVCSSDLEALRIIDGADIQQEPDLFCAAKTIALPVDSEIMRYILQHSPIRMLSAKGDSIQTRINYLEIGTAQILTIPGEDRKSVVTGKSVSVRVDRGGLRNIKKKK